MRRQHSHNTGFKIAGVAALAAAVGATVAMLFTPKNGNEVRGGLKRRARGLTTTVTNKVPDLADDVEEAATAAQNKARSAATSAKTQTRAAKTQAKTTAKRTVRKTSTSK